MKLAPLIEELRKFPSKFTPILVHTGQHYDYELSEVFFHDLSLPEPDLYLGIGSGSHSEQTGKVLIEFERVVLNKHPDIIIVVGDVNSTLGCSIVGSKLMIPIAHIEAGLRSFDRSMPEEINRVVTDVLSDFLFTTEEAGNKNLLREGIPKSKIHFVGDIIVDSLSRTIKISRGSHIIDELGLKPNDYAILTIHRPSNVDIKDNLSHIVDAIKEIATRIKVVFPIHPRTQKNIDKFNISLDIKNLILTQPLGYLDFLHLEKHAKFVLTDSGGVQVETTVLNIPCLTLRDNIEKLATIEIGTNLLVGNNKSKIINEALKILAGKVKSGKIPPLWDGHTAERIVNVLTCLA